MQPYESLPEPVRRGIDLINKGLYFEAHEVLEEFWRQDTSAYRQLYQALIQVSVCLYHFQRGNTRGAIKLAQRAIAILQTYAQEILPLNLERLVEDLHLIEKETFRSSNNPEGFFPVVIHRGNNSLLE